LQIATSSQPAKCSSSQSSPATPLTQQLASSQATQYSSSQGSPATQMTQPVSGDFGWLSQYGAALSPLKSHSETISPNGSPHEEVNEGRKRSRDSKFQFLVQRFKITEVREVQRTALHLLLDSCAIDTKIIQAPTSTGKDMLPFAMAVLTGKAQLIFVPFVALIDNVIQEGAKFKCRVVKFSDIHRSIDVATAAATADCIICSYEHAPKAVRIAQELLSRERMGWCWFNEAHVLELDASFRDFGSIYEVCLQCPQVCCMTATLQPRHVVSLAQKLGRKGFSESMLVCPSRPQLEVGLKVTTDAKAWIAQELKRQPAGQRAIVFCLFKQNVTEMAAYLKGTLESREILECVSGAIHDMAMFRKLSSAIMVCTSVLAAGVSFDTVTMVFFLSCAHGPEYFLQGAGRGARSEQEKCVATLVSTRRDLENHQRSKMSGEILSRAL
jgi:superfamily II DNA/RNA helicase